MVALVFICESLRVKAHDISDQFVVIYEIVLRISGTSCPVWLSIHENNSL